MGNEFSSKETSSEKSCFLSISSSRILVPLGFSNAIDFSSLIISCFLFLLISSALTNLMIESILRLGKSLFKEIELLASFIELKLSIDIGYRLFLFKGKTTALS